MRTTSTVEWLVKGEPGSGFPPYRFVYTNESAARAFATDGRLRWTDGPHLFRRIVTVTEWEPVAPPTAPAPLTPEQPPADHGDGSGAGGRSGGEGA